jgi:hypothetical protein
MPAEVEAESAISPQAESPKPSRTKRVLVGVAFCLLALGGAYGVGRLQTAGLIDEAESRTQDVERQRQAGLAELHAERQKVERLNARRRLHLALLALEDRNFGIAQSEIALAGKLLQQSGPTANDAFSKIAAEMQQHQLVATEDLNAQRQKLLGWARALDAALN